MRPAHVLPVAALTLLAAACSREAAGPAARPDDGHAETVAFRAKHEESYRREYVTIAGLHFLKDGPQTAGSSPASDIVLPASAPPILGTFVVRGTDVRFEPDAKANTRLNGQPLSGPATLKDDSTKADEINAGGITVAVHRSGARESIRVWEPDGRQARDFRGFTWFDIQPEYRVVGQFMKDAEPRTLQIPNTFGDLDPNVTEGVVEFTLQGQRLRLRPFTTRPGRLWFVFKDASSGHETYVAARFLYADLKDDGSVVLDFNQAYNPPCAFNPFTTCPLPMAENRLPIKILAGEKDYPVHVPLPGA